MATGAMHCNTTSVKQLQAPQFVEMATAAMNCNTTPVKQSQAPEPSAHSDAVSSVAITGSAATQVDFQEQIILLCNQTYIKSHDCPLRLTQLVSN